MKCVHCGEEIVDGQALCDSFKCMMEDRAYDDFVALYGSHCYICFCKLRDSMEQEPRPFSNGIPSCAKCGDNSYVIPVRDRSGEVLGWLCQVCDWQFQNGKEGS